MLDRIDIQIDVPAVTAADLALPPSGEGSVEVAARVAAARALQRARGAELGAGEDLTNGRTQPPELERIAAPDEKGAALLSAASEALALSARGYHRTLRVARTIADLDGARAVGRAHIAEALSLRRQWARAEAGPAIMRAGACATS